MQFVVKAIYSCYKKKEKKNYTKHNSFIGKFFISDKHNNIL